MKALIVDGENRRTANIFPFSDGLTMITVFQTRKVGGDMKWFHPQISWPEKMTGTPEQAQLMIEGLQEAIRIYNEWLAG